MKKIKLFGVLFMAGLSVQAAEMERYNFLEDATVKLAKSWQNGGKAKTILSTDGKLIFAYGQSMPTLTCTPLRACDVEMEPGELVQPKFPIGDTVNWGVTSGVHIENGQQIQHVIFQPRDVNLETNAIIYTDRRAYHIRLHSPVKEGDYLNRIAFYYPSKMVVEWKAAEVAKHDETKKAAETYILDAPTSPDKLDFGYRLEGNAEFAPVRVFNDGERTYFEMPDSVRHGESPILYLRDEGNQVQLVNYRVKDDPETGKIHYVVDKLFAVAELKIGTQGVQIFWKKKDKSVWQKMGLGKN